MSDAVFYTTFTLPEETTTIKIKRLMRFLDISRSVATHSFNGREGTVTIVVAGNISSLKYSECPLPGSHDYVAGWLAHEAMMTVSKYLHAPLYWQEGEWYKNEHGGGTLHPARIKESNKPPIKIDWEDWATS